MSSGSLRPRPPLLSLAGSLAFALAFAAPPLVLPARPAAASPLASESLTLEPVEDAYVDERLPATNYNSAPAWPVEHDAQDRERYPLLRFDTGAIPAESQVLSAELELWLEQGSGEPLVDLVVQRITLGWDEATVRWNNRPPMQGTWATTEVGTQPGWRSWDLRVLTQNWVRQAYPNHGLVLRGPAGVEAERLFESTGSRKPRLVVVFEPPTPTPSDTPTSSPTPTATSSPTATPSPTPTATSSPTATPSPTPTATSSPTATPSPTPTATSSPTATASPSPSPSATPSPTPTTSPTASVTASVPPADTPSATPTDTPASSPTPTGTDSPTPGGPTPTAVATIRPTSTAAPATGTPGPGTATGTPAGASPTPPPPTPTGLQARAYLPALQRGPGD